MPSRILYLQLMCEQKLFTVTNQSELQMINAIGMLN